MTSDQRTAIRTKIGFVLMQALGQIGCIAKAESIDYFDDEASPLFQKVGDHIVFSVAGVIRIEDFLEVNPELRPAQIASVGLQEDLAKAGVQEEGNTNAVEVPDPSPEE